MAARRAIATSCGDAGYIVRSCLTAGDAVRNWDASTGNEHRRLHDVLLVHLVEFLALSGRE